MVSTDCLRKSRITNKATFWACLGSLFWISLVEAGRPNLKVGSNIVWAGDPVHMHLRRSAEHFHFPFSVSLLWKQCGQLPAQVLFPLLASSGNVFTAPRNGGNTVLIYMFAEQMWSSISYVLWVTLFRVLGTELWATHVWSTWSLVNQWEKNLIAHKSYALFWKHFFLELTGNKSCYYPLEELGKNYPLV